CLKAVLCEHCSQISCAYLQMNVGFRKLVESDKAILETWIAGDSDHRGKITPEFFFTDIHLAMVLGDKEPGLFLRIDPEGESVRLHIQFSTDWRRSAKTMLRGWSEVRDRVGAAGAKRIVFESTSGPLIGFCKRAFGFQQVQGNRNDYELMLPEVE